MTAAPPRSAATNTARIPPPTAPISRGIARERLIGAPAWRPRYGGGDSRGFGRGVGADDGIAAARQVDPHRIVAPFIGVILDQAAAQSAGLDAHERIRLSIEVRRTAEHLDGDGVAFEAVALAGKRLLHDKTQKARGARGLLEAAARENPLELRSYLYGAGLEPTPAASALRCLREWDNLGRAPPRESLQRR